MEMCPFRAASKIVRLVKISLAVLRVAHAGHMRPWQSHRKYWELKASLASALSTSAQHLPGIACYASLFFTQERESYKSAHLGARGVMLRIPPPEDDGFALALIKMECERPVGILGEWNA